MGFWDTNNSPATPSGSNSFFGNYKINQQATDDFTKQLQDEELKKRQQEAEQAWIDAENNKSMFQKVKEYVTGQASYAYNNPAQAAKNVGNIFVSGIKAAGEDISAPFMADAYSKVNEENTQKSAEMDNKIIAAIKNTTDPAEKDKLTKLLQDRNANTNQIDVFKEVPTINKTAVQVFSDFAAMGLDMAGIAGIGESLAVAGGKTLLKAGAKTVGESMIKAAGKDAAESLAKKTFFKTVLDGAGWGSAYGGLGAAQQGEDIKGIAKGAATGAIFGAALGAIGEGLGKGVEALKDRPMNNIRKNLTDEFDQHLIGGVNDAKLATEILDNGSKSIKLSASLPESLSHLGEDISVTTPKSEGTGFFDSIATDRPLMATEEGQRSVAGSVVTSKMSPEAKKAIYNEIKGSELFKIESNDSVDSVVQRGVESVLANGSNVRGDLNLTSKYTDSVLGVINPQLAEVEAAATKNIADKAATTVTPTTPEAPAPSVETSNPNIPKTEGQYHSNFPEKTVATVGQNIDFKGIKPENIVHFNQGDQYGRVSMIVPAEDKKLIQAGRPWDHLGNAEKNKKISASIKQIATERGITEKEARDLAVETSNRYKEIAKQNRTSDGDILLNTVTKPEDRMVNTPKTPTESPTSPSATTSTEKGSVTPPEAQTEQTFAPKDGVSRKIPEEMMNHEQFNKVFTELETAQPGYRRRGAALGAGEGSGYATDSMPSSFPKWVPPELRSRDLFDKVQMHILEGTVPTKAKELALYDVVHNQLRVRMDMPEINFPTEKKIIKSQQMTPDMPIRSGSGERDISRLSERYNEMFNNGQTPMTHEVAHNEAQIVQALEEVKTDSGYQRGIRISTGVEKSETTLTNAMSLAVLDKARAIGDVATEDAVVKSMVNRTSRAAQELQITSKLTGDPMVESYRSVLDSRRSLFEKNNPGQKVNEVVSSTIKEIDSHMPSVNNDEFTGLVESIMCSS